WCGVLIYGGILAWQVYRNWASLCLGALLVLARVTTTLAEELNVTVLRPVPQVAHWTAPQPVTLWLLPVAAAWALLLGWAASGGRGQGRLGSSRGSPPRPPRGFCRCWYHRAPSPAACGRRGRCARAGACWATSAGWRGAGGGERARGAVALFV